MSNIKTASLEEIRDMKTKGELLEARQDAPQVDLPDDFWDDAELVHRPAKKSVHLRVDEDIFRYFQAGGKGHLTRMNAVLRTYVDAQKKDLSHNK